MTPIKLILDNFCGIRSGQGKDHIEIDFTKIPTDARLVALVAPNGSGKTTILDNMHPYRVMPSRSKTLGPGGFAFYSEIFGSKALKEFWFSHAGVKYRSLLSFHMTSKTQKADCYLQVWNDTSETWVPYIAADRTESDGKTSSYDRCLESIMGPPETFFTSDFTAQCAKSLSSYSNSEIKDLLASMLNLSDLQAKATKANEIGKMLRVKLSDKQDELALARNASAQSVKVKEEIAQFDVAVSGRGAVEREAQAVIDHAKQVVANLEAKRDALAQDVEQRAFFEQEIARTRNATAASVTRLRDQSQRELRQIADNRKRVTAAMADETAKQPALARELARLNAVLSSEAAIEAARKDLPVQRQQEIDLDAQIEALQAKLATLKPVQVKLNKDEAQAATLLTEGKAKAAIVITLQETASLIDKVPCNATKSFQTTCPLLANANAAMQKIGAEQSAVQDKRAQYRELMASIAAGKLAVAEVDGIEESINRVAKLRNGVSRTIISLTELCGEGAMLNEAKERAPVLKEAIAGFESFKAAHAVQVMELDDAEERIRHGLDKSIAEVTAESDKSIAQLQAQLAKFEAPITEAAIAAARQTVHTALKALEDEKVITASYQSQRNALCVELEGLRATQRRTAETTVKAEAIAEEIAKWRRIEVGCGNNGLIALSIDDAGPEIAGYCNDVLKKCFGGRFTVRLDTQQETKTGTMKESFNVMVFDGDRGDEKSLSDMSPGERVWINASLTNAIALYRGDAANTHPETKFSDEADGPLDPDRKRMFMGMKRAVLELGGYQREYFISHTPELQAMADYQLHVAEL